MSIKNKNNRRKLIVQNVDIKFFLQKESDYISLTDIAKYKNLKAPADVVKNWMRTKSTVEFLGIWEKINNLNFKLVEFDQFWKEAGGNTFTLSPNKWIQKAKGVGLISKSGRGGGTFAHKDIAFEFASWVSAEFKLYLIKEFQRLKAKEDQHSSLEWDAKRFLAKANYRVHTDAVKENLIPDEITKKQVSYIYADEGDILNVALFGMTAKEWRKQNPKLKGNMRDYVSMMKLVCLAGLESLNAEFIRQKLSQPERLQRLNQISIIQMKSLVASNSINKLK